MQGCIKATLLACLRSHRAVSLRNMLQSTLRVQSAEEADIVYLPIYADLGCRLAQVRTFKGGQVDRT